MLLVAGCRALPAGFVCTESSQCEQAAVKGRCEPDTGYCSFPDPTCQLGWRYGDLAGGGYGGTCVGEVTDGGGIPDGPDDGPRDGPHDGPHDVGPLPDGADDGPVQQDRPPQQDAQDDSGACCDTCHDTCYAKCWDTCYDTCYDTCCYDEWDGAGCSGAPGDYVCQQVDLDNGCDTYGTYDCGSGYNCNPHQCTTWHDCNPNSCTLSKCLCSPLSCEPYDCNLRQCNCHDC